MTGVLTRICTHWLVIVHVASECVSVYEESSVLFVIDFYGVICVSLFIKWYPNKLGRTPLWIAAQEGHLKVVKYFLMRVGVNPNQPNEV